MLTLFTTPKPFVGHVAVIQRNALQSWKSLHPHVEVILFGNEEGAAAVCRELGIRHVPAVRRNALQTKRQRPAQWIDYFVFSKGLYYQKAPEFVIGRPGWDNWLIWFALSSRAAVVDLSSDVCAVHQNHDYSYHADGERGVWQGEEAQENYRLLEKGRKFRTLKSAVYVLQSGRLRANPSRWLVLPARHVRGWFYRAWFSLLNLTRPIRHRLGLKQEALARKSR